MNPEISLVQLAKDIKERSGRNQSFEALLAGTTLSGELYDDNIITLDDEVIPPQPTEMASGSTDQQKASVSSILKEIHIKLDRIVDAADGALTGDAENVKGANEYLETVVANFQSMSVQNEYNEWRVNSVQQELLRQSCRTEGEAKAFIRGLNCAERNMMADENSSFRTLLATASDVMSNFMTRVDELKETISSYFSSPLQPFAPSSTASASVSSPISSVDIGWESKLLSVCKNEEVAKSLNPLFSTLTPIERESVFKKIGKQILTEKSVPHMPEYIKKFLNK